MPNLKDRVKHLPDVRKGRAPSELEKYVGDLEDAENARLTALGNIRRLRNDSAIDWDEESIGLMDELLKE